MNNKKELREKRAIKRLLIIKKIKLVCFFILLAFLSFILLRGCIKTKASTNYQTRSAMTISQTPGRENYVFFSISNYGIGNNENFTLLSFNYTDNDGAFSGNLIQAKYDIYNEYFYLNDNINYVIYPNTIYCCCISPLNSNVDIIEIFLINVEYDNQNESIFYDIEAIYNIESPYFYSDGASDIYYHINAIYLTAFYTSGGRITIALIDELANKILSPTIKDFINTGYRYGYYQGSVAGYNAGYDAGQAGENAITPAFSVLTSIFAAIGAIFSIELVPHIPLGLFFLVPLFFAVLGLILWIWRRN